MFIVFYPKIDKNLVRWLNTFLTQFWLVRLAAYTIILELFTRFISRWNQLQGQEIIFFLSGQH